MSFLPDMSVYLNRFLSYINWPSDKPISAIKLAGAGFYYTGYLTTVKCYSCGVWIFEWKEGDVPLEVHQALSPMCEFLANLPRNGTFIGDLFPLDSSLSVRRNYNQTQPITTTADNQTSPFYPERQFQSSNRDRAAFVQYANSVSRIASFRGWPFNYKQNSIFLVESGFFYTGEADHVKCFWCDIGLKDLGFHDDPWTVHARYSPHCGYLRGKTGQEFIDRVQTTWRQPYRPQNPFYENYYNRLQTYTNWKPEYKRTPTELAEAGFYYSGYDDCVRCFYCGGGLRKWEQDDDPWTEHARWFPHCAYVCKMKGSAFIDTIERRFNNSGDMGSRIMARNVPGTNAQPTNTACGNGHSTVIQSRQHISLCKECLKNTSTVTLFPCGHLVTCDECAKHIAFCPLCGRTVVRHLKNRK